MDGYYVTDPKYSNLGQAHSARCQNALSHKALRYLSANCSDIMDITIAKKHLDIHTEAAISPNDIKQV